MMNTLRLDARVFLWVILVFVLKTELPLHGQVVQWKAVGAAPNTGGQVENIVPNNEIVGAIEAIGVHPTNANVLYVGAVNGGIWRSDDAMEASPKWTILTDQLDSLSIGAIEFDPLDSSFQTLIAGIGGNSSFGTTGSLEGVLYTTDGLNFRVLNGMGAISGLRITGVAARGPVLVLSAASTELSTVQVGVWRSTDTGLTWSRLSGESSSGLPDGRSFDLASDPKDPTILYAHAGNGVYKSSNQGQTWARISNAAIEGKLTNCVNLEFAVGTQNNLFVAIVGNSGRLVEVFRSGDGGATWASMGVPKIAEGGIHPGGQGSLHLSLAADPTSPSVVYIGGDRQDLPVLPNSIGANDYSGCLFRGDASKPLAEQWVHLTHSKSLGAPGGGTANGSAPHADSRAMAVATNGVLIESDDGGVYRRTNPRDNTGDWFSLNGNLQTSEYHAIAWDSNAKVVVAGAQDTGSSEQALKDNLPFRSISTADGGVVAVDDKTTTGRSIRYSSYQYLGGFTRRTFDASNVLLSEVGISLMGTPNVQGQFYTPFVLNSTEPKRMVIGASNGVFESSNRGDSVRLIGPGIVANQNGQDPIAYGAGDNIEAVYVGAWNGVYIRSAAHPSPLTASIAYSGGMVMGIAMHPDAWKKSYVIDPARVWGTTDGGASWTDLTANLNALKPRTLRSVVYIKTGSEGILVVGSDKGVFARNLSAAGTWSKLGKGLPKVAVYHLEYDEQDMVLLAGTLGRGAWTIVPTSTSTVPQLLELATKPPQSPSAAAIPAAAQVPNAEKRAIEIYEGVLVDPDSDSAILMARAEANELGAIEAVRIADGKSLWRTQEGHKPLSMSTGKLVAQVQSEVANEFGISILDARTGQRIISQKSDLAPGISCALDAKPEGRFRVKSSAASASATIAWQFDARKLSGVRPGVIPLEVGFQAPAATGNRIGALSGSFHLDLNNGEIRPLNIETPTASMNSNFVPIEDRVAGVEGEQYATLDGDHVVGSVESDNEMEWERYIHSVYNKSNGQLIGSFKNPFAALVVAIVQNRIIVIQEESKRLDGEEIVSEPLSIRAYDFAGRPIWTRPLRDTAYRGPLPP